MEPLRRNWVCLYVLPQIVAVASFRCPVQAFDSEL